MGLISLNCPNCGAKLDNLDDSRDMYFCTYCGHTITHDKTIIEHRGSINLTGVANENSLLQRAKNFMEEGDFANAKAYCDRVLDINPANGAAYMGLLLCKYCARDTEALRTQVPVDFSSDITYQRALQYASPADRARFENVNGSEHQFLIRLTQRIQNMADGRAQIEKERDEMLQKQQYKKDACESEIRTIQYRLEGAQKEKAAADKALGKVVIKGVLILIVAIIIVIITAKAGGGWSFAGVALFFIALISQLVAYFKERHRLFRYSNPNKVIAKSKNEYNNKVNEINGIIKLINQINTNFTNRLNDYMATMEAEKQNFIQTWRQEHPNDNV